MISVGFQRVGKKTSVSDSLHLPNYDKTANGGNNEGRIASVDFVFHLSVMAGRQP